MADLLLEPFAGLTPAQMASTGQWTSVGSGVVLTIGRGGRGGATGTLGATAAQNTLRSRTLAPAGASTFVGIGVAFASFPVADADLLTLYDASAAALITLAVTPTGTIKVYRGTSGGTLLGTTAVLLSGGSVYDYLEIGPVIATAGSVEIRVRPDGVGTATQLVVISGNTKPGTSTMWASVAFGLSSLVIVSDLYVSDVTGPHNLYFKGRTKILQAVPVSDHTPGGAIGFAWTPSTGTDKFAVVDEAPHTGDSDYLYARSAGAMLFAMAALSPDTDPVDSVQVTAIARQISSAEAQSFGIWVEAPDGARVYYGLAFSEPLATGYRAYSTVRNSTPEAGGTPWVDVAQVNATLFGPVRN